MSASALHLLNKSKLLHISLHLEINKWFNATVEIAQKDNLIYGILSLTIFIHWISFLM